VKLKPLHLKPGKRKIYAVFKRRFTNVFTAKQICKRKNADTEHICSVPANIFYSNWETYYTFVL